jgi:hypothetical protein
MILFLLVVALGSYLYFFVYHKSHADIYKTKPDVTIDALSLYSDFHDNETLANESYLGKVIRVSGQILEIQREEDRVSAIRLDVGELLDAVVCEMDQVYQRETGKLKVGDSVTLQGVCTGFLEDVILNRCAVIESH